jgi:hypothetical protein
MSPRPATAWAPAEPSFGSAPDSPKHKEPAAIVQTADYPDSTIGQLAAHELGHAMGLAMENGTDDDGVDKHSSKPDNLMHPSANIPARKLNVHQCKKARENPDLPLKPSDTDCSAAPQET